MPKFSIIVPTFQRAEFLEAAIRSVLLQTYGDFEIVVVDDASPDPVEVEMNDPRIVVVRRDSNGGAPAARNTGVSASTGEYLCFLDDDDLVTPSRLDNLVPVVRPGRIVICHQGFVDSDEVALAPSPGDDHRLPPDFFPHIGSICIRRDEWQPMDESFRTLQDQDWWLSCGRTLEHHVLGCVDYLFRIHHGARHKSGNYQRALDGERLIAKHASFFRSNPKVAAHRWHRISRMYLSSGHRYQALRSTVRSLRTAPNRAAARDLVTLAWIRA